MEYIKFCDELIDNLPEWFYNSVYDVYYPDNSRHQEIESNLLKGIFEKKYDIKQGTELYVMAYFKIVERTFSFDLKSLSFTCDLKPVESHLFHILMNLGDLNDCIFKLKELSYHQNTWHGTVEKIEI